MDNWIEHLQHPLVLVGFGLLVFAALLRPVLLKKVSGAAAERLIRKGITFTFVLALLVIIGGFSLSWKSLSVAGAGTTAFVEQSTQSGQSPAINSGESVQISYGAAPSVPKEPANKTEPVAPKQETVPVQVKQTTQGEQSPTINAQGGVEINYAE